MALEEHFDGFSPTKMGAPLKPMGSFPIAKASDILVSYDEESGEKRLDEALEESGISAFNKITNFNFSSGHTQDTTIEENGIYWANDETELELEKAGYFYLGPSNHRVPLVAGDGVEFELDTQKNVVKIKSHGVVGSGGIVDVVNELPTDNINEKAIYRLANVEGEVYVIHNGTKTLFVDFFASTVESATAETYVVETLPQSIKQSTMDSNGNATLYLYIVYATGIAYIDFGDGIVTVGEFWQGGFEDKGYITNVSGDGIYCGLSKNTYTYNVYKTNDYTKQGFWVEIPTVVLEGGKKTFDIVQAVTSPELMDAILSNATTSNLGNCYVYVGPLSLKYRRGVVYRLTTEVEE